MAGKIKAFRNREKTKSAGEVSPPSRVPHRPRRRPGARSARRDRQRFYYIAGRPALEKGPMFNSSSMRGQLSSVARFLSRRTPNVTRASRKNPVRLHLEALEGR